MNKFLYLIVALAALLVGALVYVKMKVLPEPEYALYYSTAREVKPFEMTDHLGNAFTGANFQGKWSWLFFGYTSCPDVCPTTLQELNFSYQDLQKISPNNQVVLVSVDPMRDSQAKLAQYIAYFNSDFVALRAEHDVLFPFARNLGLMYAITSQEDAKEQNAGYLVDHSAAIVLVNPEGKIAAIFKPQHVLGQLPIINGAQLTADFARIVALYQHEIE